MDEGEGAPRKDGRIPSEMQREKSGRQRYSEQRERLANRVAERKEKAKQIESKEKPSTASQLQSNSTILDLPNSEGVKFASDLEAQWQRDKKTEETSNDDSDKPKDIVSVLPKGAEGVGIVDNKVWSLENFSMEEALNTLLGKSHSLGEVRSKSGSKIERDVKNDGRDNSGQNGSYKTAQKEKHRDDVRKESHSKVDASKSRGKDDTRERGKDREGSQIYDAKRDTVYNRDTRGTTDAKDRYSGRYRENRNSDMRFGRRGDRDDDKRFNRKDERKEDKKNDVRKNNGTEDSRRDNRRDERSGKSTSASEKVVGGVKKGAQSKATEKKVNDKVNEDKKEEHQVVKVDEEQLKIEIEKEKQEEKRRKEEEERIEQEKIKMKEEADRKQIEDEQNLLQSFLKEQEDKINRKNALRELNVAAAENPPDETFFTKLDSNLKKNTAFVKKVKSLTESQGESIIKDFENLNLTKYIGEVAVAITDAKLKMADISMAVQLCSVLHQRYVDFSQMLLDNFYKLLLNKKDTKIVNASKLRVDLRFLAELTSVSIFSGNKGLSFLASQLSYLVHIGKEDHIVLPIVSTFCRHCGDDYAGLIPRNIRLLAEKYHVTIPHNQFLPPERQIACRNLLREYYNAICSDLVSQHKKLKKMEYATLQSLKMKGELSQERKDAYEQAFDSYQKLHTNVSSLSNMLDEDMPDLPDEELKQDPESVLLDIGNTNTSDLTADAELFEDEDTRMFYEKLADLKAVIPNILYKESEQMSTKDECKDDESGLDEDLSVDDAESQDLLAEGDGLLKEMPESDDSAIGDTPPMLLPDIIEDDTAETNHVMKAQLDIYLSSLPTCVNRDLIDKAAVEFCMNFNTKINRKKLVRALFTVQRTRYDLLPFYSRLVATLYPCMPDIANELVLVLKSEMKWHIKKKMQHNIESKLKTARFIGELVKFKIFPKSECLHLVKMLIFTFTNHNIEMVTALLETCGRFLYRSKDSHHRTGLYLDVLLRKKTAMHLDSRHLAMIENAYYYCNPPDVAAIPKKVRPPLHEYIRKLIFKDLSKLTTEKVLRQLRKLDWNDEDSSNYATKCLCQPWNIRYNIIHCLANLVSGLTNYNESVSVCVVDAIVEDIRIGMEVNHPRYNQRRVTCVKYLAELYNYRIIESSVVFKVLYSLITFGVSLDGSQISVLDPPDHLLRLRLVSILLDTCGQYFETSSSKRRLNCFLVYFQKYYWMKRENALWSETRPFPIDVDNFYHDTLDILNPKDRYENLDAVKKAAETLDREFRIKISKLLPEFEASVGEFDRNATEMDGLTTVLEEDETDDLREGVGDTGQEDGGSTLESDNSQPSQSHQASKDSGSDTENGGSAEDDKVKVKKGLKHVPCEEDNDFVQAFDRMLTDSMQARTQETLKVPQLDLAVPMRLKAKKPTDDTNGKPINFVLITRKGNKQQFSTMEVPISEEFASKYREREKAEIEEKLKIKEAVLNIHERQEEEDYQELIASLNRTMAVNTNRERRIQYQHPKGAPDADLIFGSKKR